MSPVTADGAKVGHLVALLDHRAAHGRTRFVRCPPDGGPPGELTAGALARRSAELATRLPGPDGAGREGAVLVVRDPLVFAIAFFAALRAGLVPVPAPFAVGAGDRPGHRRRLRAIVTTCRPRLVLTDRDQVPDLPPDLPVIRADGPADPAQDLTPAGSMPAPPAAATAYVQYTSGSLSDPQPVPLTHANVLAQLRQAAEAFGETTDGVAVSWVPLYHDMGLVTGLLRPLWSGCASVLLDPFDFVRDPALWLRAITRHRATHTSAPDFGYALAVRKVRGTGGLDLRTLRVARSAGEPVRSATLRAFAEKFGPAGFRPSSFAPSYGLAEATLTVTSSPLDTPPAVLDLSAKGLREGRAIPPAAPSDSRPVVSCGPPVRDTRVEILHPETLAPLGGDTEGEVWISGPQVSAGARGAHRVGGRDGLRTGDMGFLHAGELYLLGRSQERFQTAGENHYSGELETLATESDPRLRPGRAAVFTGHRDGWPEPLPVVLAECRAGTGPGDGEEVARRIVAALGRGTGLAVRCVWLLPPGTLPVTTSGKIRRERCRTAFELDALATLYRYERGLT